MGIAACSAATCPNHPETHTILKRTTEQIRVASGAHTQWQVPPVEQATGETYWCCAPATLLHLRSQKEGAYDVGSRPTQRRPKHPADDTHPDSLHLTKTSCASSKTNVNHNQTRNGMCIACRSALKHVCCCCCCHSKQHDGHACTCFRSPMCRPTVHLEHGLCASLSTECAGVQTINCIPHSTTFRYCTP